MAEDVVGMEEIGSAYINFNYTNFVFSKIMCREIRTYETVSRKRHHIECNAD